MTKEPITLADYKREREDHESALVELNERLVATVKAIIGVICNRLDGPENNVCGFKWECAGVEIWDSNDCTTEIDLITGKVKRNR